MANCQLMRARVLCYCLFSRHRLVLSLAFRESAARCYRRCLQTGVKAAWLYVRTAERLCAQTAEWLCARTAVRLYARTAVWLRAYTSSAAVREIACAAARVCVRTAMCARVAAQMRAWGSARSRPRGCGCAPLPGSSCRPGSPCRRSGRCWSW